MKNPMSGYRNKQRDALRERIKKIMQEEPEISNPDLAQRFGVSNGYIRKLRRKLKQENPGSGYLGIREFRKYNKKEREQTDQKKKKWGYF